MRVLQVTPSFVVAGAERMIVHLLTGLKALGHEVGAVSLYANDGTELDRLLAARGIEVTYLGKRLGPDPRVLPRLARAMRAFRPAIVHTHNYVLRYVLPALIGSGRCRVVHTLHNLARMEVDAPGRLIHQVAFRSGVSMVAIGDAVAESASAMYGRRPVAIIPHGIPTEEYRRAGSRRDEVRAAMGVRPDQIAFLNLARMSPQKNLPALVDAFAALCAVGVDAVLWIAGDGPDRPALARQVAALDPDAASRVRLLGVRSDVPELLAAADAFVLSSLWEGNPLSVMEAMAAGRVVVATAVGGVPELVEHGKSGLLVEPGDVAALTAAMRQIALDRAARERLGRSASEHAAQAFDVQAMARSYERVYERCLRDGRELRPELRG